MMEWCFFLSHGQVHACTVVAVSISLLKGCFSYYFYTKWYCGLLSWEWDIHYRNVDSKSICEDNKNKAKDVISCVVLIGWWWI